MAKAKKINKMSELQRNMLNSAKLGASGGVRPSIPRPRVEQNPKKVANKMACRQKISF